MKKGYGDIYPELCRHMASLGPNELIHDLLCKNMSFHVSTRVLIIGVCMVAHIGIIASNSNYGLSKDRISVPSAGAVSI